MKILVTGGMGFIGSNFLNYMVKKYPDYIFYNLDNMYYCANYNNISEETNNSNNYKFKKGDINNMEILKNLINNFEITHIIHFAAQSHVDNSFNDSLQYTYDNVKGTHTILEAIRIYNKNIKFLHFSTDEVYGESNSDLDIKSENSILCPTNPYAASKASAEMYVNSYIHSFNLNIIITRCNNVYGQNQYPEKLIPKFIKLLKENKKCTIHGDGSSIRSFIHVHDVCTAVDLIIHKGINHNIYNIGSEQEKSVLEVTKYLINIIKNDNNYNNYINFVEDRPFNDKRYFINFDKLKNLGWEQTIDFYDGINDLL